MFLVLTLATLSKLIKAVNRSF